MPKLTQSQIQELQRELVANGHPVRFLFNGRCVNIENGELQPKGINVIYHLVYWNFTRETSKKIAKWLSVKAVFSK